MKDVDDFVVAKKLVVQTVNGKRLSEKSQSEPSTRVSWFRQIVIIEDM